MKPYVIFLLTSMIFMPSCFAKQADQEEITPPSQNSSKFMDVVIISIEKGTFTREESENTLLLKRRGYAGAYRLKIKIKNYSEPLEGVVYYGANQYTIDDIPAFSLNVSFQEPVVLHKNSDGNYHLSEILKPWKEIETLITVKYFDLFLDESIEAQKEVYIMILNDKNFSECCPGYIKQAKVFFSKKNMISNL